MSNPDDGPILETHEVMARSIATVLEGALADPSTMTDPTEIWLAAGRQAVSKRRIYLDKNVWIWIRDADLGRAQSQDHERLSQGLSALAERGTHVCPASDIVLYETLRQRDERTRIATAEAIDRLSTGLALAPYERRREIEFFRWILGTLAPGFTLRPAEAAVWLPVFHVVEPLVPHSTDVDPEFLRALQHAFLTTSTAMSLSDLMAWMAPLDDMSVTGTSEQEFADEITDTIAEHTDPAWTYDDLFAIEFRAGIVSSDEALSSAIRSVGIILGGADAGEAHPSVIEQYADIALRAHAAGTLGNALPSLHVAASHPAMIRLDRSRRYKKGDRMDSLHAAAALPYCDVLFTESSLRHLLTTAPASLASRFGCEVVSGATEMVAFVEEELATPD